MTIEFPTSKDIYFQVGTTKVAIVQNYSTSYSKEDKEVDAFGEAEPVGFTPGKKQYGIKITKAYITDVAKRDNINFYTLNNFEFKIVKQDKIIVYGGCSITNIDEEGSLNDVIAENISIRASSRREDKR
jgi:hypothetical protein